MTEEEENKVNDFDKKQNRLTKIMLVVVSPIIIALAILVGMWNG